jgi:glucose dehydrogenase
MPALYLGAPSASAASPPPGWVDTTRLTAASQEPQNWFTDGRDQGATYFSPLRSVNAGSVGRLGFAWQYDLGTSRGQEGLLAQGGMEKFSDLLSQTDVQEIRAYLIDEAWKAYRDQQRARR